MKDKEQEEERAAEVNHREELGGFGRLWLGSWAATWVGIMAGDNPTDEEAEFWNRWKDEMKEGR